MSTHHRLLTIFLAGLRFGLRFGLRCHADRWHRPLCCRPAKIREEAAVAEKESLQQEPSKQVLGLAYLAFSGVSFCRKG